MTENEKIGMRDTDERLEMLGKDEKKGKAENDEKLEKSWKGRKSKDELKKKKKEILGRWRSNIEPSKREHIKGVSRGNKWRGGRRGRGCAAWKGLSGIRS